MKAKKHELNYQKNFPQTLIFFKYFNIQKEVWKEKILLEMQKKKAIKYFNYFAIKLTLPSLNALLNIAF